MQTKLFLSFLHREAADQHPEAFSWHQEVGSPGAAPATHPTSACPAPTDMKCCTPSASCTHSSPWKHPEGQEEGRLGCLHPTHPAAPGVKPRKSASEHPFLPRWWVGTVGCVPFPWPEGSAHSRATHSPDLNAMQGEAQCGTQKCTSRAHGNTECTAAITHRDSFTEQYSG